MNDNLVIRMNGKIYEMNQQRHLSEIKKINTSGERWKIQFGDYILERQQRLYMTNQKTKQKIAITPQNAYVRAIHLSPDRRYLVSELWPSQEKPIYSVYDTVAQKKIRDIDFLILNIHRMSHGIQILYLNILLSQAADLYISRMYILIF
ncbi:hypothetical protein [Paenibacillus sp. FSL L8-0494]|uniref:hypothetical protein n=1 Tax=Paenibacillus sp. FSL L8-0494 TaxID=2975352 RepID=UPI0030F576E7